MSRVGNRRVYGKVPQNVRHTALSATLDAEGNLTIRLSRMDYTSMKLKQCTVHYGPEPRNSDGALMEQLAAVAQQLCQEDINQLLLF